jgi:polysaccharide chain length determinant protein (PEP-CTERM system associated)
MIRDDITLDDAIAIAKRHWILLVALAMTGAGLGYIATRVLPKKYTSVTLVLVEQPKVSDEYVHPVVSDDINQRLASMQQEILSRARLEPIIRQYGLYGNDINTVPMDKLVGRLQSGVTVSPVQAMAETQSQGLPGFTVSVAFADPGLAQKICSTITSMFTEENAELRKLSAKQTAEFLQTTIDDAKAKLDAQDARLADFKRRYLGQLPDEEQTNLNVLTGLTSQLDAATQALSRAQQDKSFAESMLGQQLQANQASQAGQVQDTLETQLAGLQGQLTVLRSKYTDDYPDVVKLRNDIATLQKKIADASAGVKPADATPGRKPAAEPTQVQNLRAQIAQHDIDIKQMTAQQDDIQRQIKLYQARVQSSPAVEQEYKAVTRDYNTALDFYNDLLKKRDQSAMASDLEQRQEGEQFRVLDQANLPTDPSFPRPTVFIPSGLGAGICLGVCIAFLMEFRDTSLRTESEVESLLQLPVLAMVPAMNAEPSGKVPGPARPSVGAVVGV